MRKNDGTTNSTRLQFGNLRTCRFRKVSQYKHFGQVWSMCNVPWPTPGVTTNWEADIVLVAVVYPIRGRGSALEDKGHTSHAR